jgi:hypothetical protein
MSDILDTVRLVGAALIAVALVAVVLSAVFGVISVGGVGSISAVFEPAPDTFAEGELADTNEEPDTLDVRLSTGTGVALNGTGYVDDPTDPSRFDMGSDWAVATTVEPATLNPNATYTVYAADNETVHVLYEAGEYTVRYDDGVASGYAAVPANEDAQTTLVVSFDYGDDILQLRTVSNGTEYSDTTGMTADATPARDVTYRWRGTIDEVRVWDRDLTTSEQRAYTTAPVEPVAPGNATVRAMFNDNALTTVYYNSGSATLAGDATATDGVVGPTLSEGSDYDVQTGPLAIRGVSDRLANAPVAFVVAGGSGGGGPFVGLYNTVTSVGSAALALIVIGTVVLAARAVTDDFGGF